MTKAVLSLVSIVSLFGLSACTTTSKSDAVAPADNSTKIEVTQNYNAYVERYSSGDTEYAGLYNNFEYRATLLNSDIRKGLTWKRGNFFQWNETQIESDREKSNQEMSSETKVFMAFFTPSPKNDNLTDDKSIWRIYLEAGGHRYEGKPKRVRLLLAELQALYPYTTRWTTPYEVTFAVPTSAIENMESTYIVTGPLGARSITFPALH